MTGAIREDVIMTRVITDLLSGGCFLKSTGTLLVKDYRNIMSHKTTEKSE